jgi:SET family sugar efflux transporter-like MFS transporter
MRDEAGTAGQGGFMAGRGAILARVWAHHDYRAILFVVLLLALGTSSGTPLLSLFLVERVGIPLPAAGLFSASIALPGLLLGIILGRRSDHWGSRLPFVRGGTIWVALGWGLLALSPFRWLTLTVGALFLSLAGTLMGLVFAALHDAMTRDAERQPALVNTLVRTGWSLGYVFGVLLGVQLAANVGYRGAFLGTAALYLACLLPLATLRVPVRVATAAQEDSGSRQRGDLLLYAFVALCATVLSGQAIKNTFLPLAVTTHLGGTVATYGTIVAVSPIIELVTIPLAGLLATRLGLGRLIAGGLVIGVLEYAILGLNDRLWPLYLTQALDACVVAVLLGLGVSYAQRLTPTRPGAASGLYFSALNISILIGGISGAATVPFLGIPRVFLLPAALFALGTFAFLAIERQSERLHAEMPQPAATHD